MKSKGECVNQCLCKIVEIFVNIYVRVCVCVFCVCVLCACSVCVPVESMRCWEVTTHRVPKVVFEHAPTRRGRISLDQIVSIYVCVCV